MIFCEPFAGSAAISYALLGAKPPISYMGGKTGYVAPIPRRLVCLAAPWYHLRLEYSR